MKNSVLNQFEQSLFEALLNGDRIRLGQQIITAVSGGKDSMTLLYFHEQDSRQIECKN